MLVGMNLTPSQTVTPQMIATMNILQYGTQELSDYLSELSCSNPMVELSEPEKDKTELTGGAGHDAQNSQAQAEQERFALRRQWLREHDRQNRSYYSTEEWNGAEIPDPSHGGDTLADVIRDQIMTMRLSSARYRAVIAVAELLNGHGFFDSTMEEVCRVAGVDIKEAEAALELVRSLEPAGLGASDVRDSLLLQVKRRQPVNQVSVCMLERYFHRLGSWSNRRFAGELKVSECAIEEAMEEILSLHPYPGDGYSPVSSAYNETVYIRPDLYIAVLHDHLEVWSNREELPGIRLNETYLKLMRSSDDPEVRRYLREHYVRAEQVIRNVKNRSDVMLQCAEVIAQLQEDYFRGGQLHPMTMKDVAAELGVHESTVSRAVRDKYIQYERGIVPMDYFFSRSVGRNDSMSRHMIMEVMREILREEDRRNPLKDEEMSELMEVRGISISRRTVAKYRCELGVPTASNRKVV